MNGEDRTSAESAGSLDDLFAGVRAAGAAPERRAPFKFLDPYGPDDADIFFGRGVETAELFAAFHRSRLLVVYGESGAGKTSLVQCGLRSRIPPEDMRFLTVRCARDPIDELTATLVPLAGLDPDRRAPPPSSSASSSGSSESAGASTAPLLREAVLRKGKAITILFDQFEELYLFQPPAVRERLADEIAGWLADDLDVRVVLILREEYLARLTETEERIRRAGRERGRSLPGPYENRLWVRRMSAEQARDAIVEPCGRCGVEVDPELVRELVAELTREGQGAELPMLQVVLDALYAAALDRDRASPRLLLADYEKLGRLEAILGGFLEDRIAVHPDPERTRQVLKALVSAEGTRRPGSVAEIGENAAQFGDPLAPDELDAMLARLVDDRIVRRDPESGSVELRHDSLARQVHGWMTGLERELAEVRAALEARRREYVARGNSPRGLLDEGFLDYLAPYRSRLRPSGELARYVADSEDAHARGRRRRRRAAAAIVSVVVAALAVLAGWAVRNMRQAERSEETAQAERATAEDERSAAERSREAALEAKAQADEQRAAAERSREEALREKTRAEARGLIAEAKRVEAAGGKPDEVLALLRAAASLDDSPESQDEVARAGLLLGAGRPLSRVLTGHRAPVIEVVAAPDGRRIGSVSSDYEALLWNAVTGELVVRLDRVSRLVFSPDGTLLAAGSTDGPARLFDAATGELVRTLEPPPSDARESSDSADDRAMPPEPRARSSDRARGGDGISVPALGVAASRQQCLAFSPDGRMLAVGFWGGDVQLWSPATGGLLHAVPGTSPITPIGVAFSPDGRVLAVASLDGFIRLIDPATGTLLRRFGGVAEPSQVVLFSPDGARIAAFALGDPIVRIWDVATGTLERTLRGHTGGVVSADWSSDGRHLAAVSGESVTVFSAENGFEVLHGFGLDTALSEATFSAGDRFVLATTALDDAPFVLDVADGRIVARLDGHAGRVTAMASCPRRAGIVSGGADGTVRLWDFGESILPRSVIDGLAEPDSFACSPDGRSLALGMHDGRVEIRGSPAGDVARTLVGHSAPVITVAFSASGDLLVTGSDDGLVRVWRVADGGLLRGVAGEGGTTAWLPVFSPDGSLLAVRVGRRLQLVELAGGATRWTADLPDHGGVTALRFTPSADGVVAAHRTGVVELYDSATGDRRHLFEGHTAPVTAIDFDPGGLLVTTSWDGTIRIWDPTDGRQIRSLFGRWGSVFCAALSPDGRRLATGHGDGRARVWDTATWTTVRKLEGPSASIRSIAFSPDGRTVAGGTLHGQVWMWDPISGAPLRASYGSASVLHLVFDPTGTLVVAGDGRGPASVSLWNTAVATFGAAVDDVGRRSNLGACRSTHAVVAVQPFSQDGAVWASEGSCGRYDDVPLAPERRQYRAGMGALTVLGDPPMQVDVDGLPVGWTPLVRFELPYGTHEWCVEALPARTCKSFALDAANRHAVWEFSHTPD